MIWYDMIWYDMIWYNIIWYDMIWYDMIWYDLIWYDIAQINNVMAQIKNIYYDMTLGEVPLDMRGRCSAGQRVLAAIVIRWHFRIRITEKRDENGKI